MKTSKADTWFSRFIRLRDATESNGKSIAVRWGLNVLLPHDSTKVN
nr:hypothetical protein [uncultured Flavobacterium sp.]